MIPLLALSSVSRFAGPILIVVAVLGAIGYHKLTVHRLEGKVSTAQQETLRKHNELLIEREARAQLETNIATLRGTVRQQNDAITALHANARAYEAAAKARAVDVLRRGERERVALKLDTKFGPAQMNLWFQTMFGSGQ